jgi:hypothetical protein
VVSNKNIRRTARFVVGVTLNVLGARLMKPGLDEVLEMQNDDLRCGVHDRDGARAVS